MCCNTRQLCIIMCFIFMQSKTIVKSFLFAFVGSQNFPRSRRRKFIDSNFGIIFLRILNKCLNIRSWGCKFVGTKYTKNAYYI